MPGVWRYVRLLSGWYCAFGSAYSGACPTAAGYMKSYPVAIGGGENNEAISLSKHAYILFEATKTTTGSYPRALEQCACLLQRGIFYSARASWNSIHTLLR